MALNIKEMQEFKAIWGYTTYKRFYLNTNPDERKEQTDLHNWLKDWQHYQDNYKKPWIWLWHFLLDIWYYFRKLRKEIPLAEKLVAKTHLQLQEWENWWTV